VSLHVLGGSLFLFDRKALRYFRKDGHRWRKKKDGKTVREAHEKELEHIVLVHYREVKEGNRSGVSRSISTEAGAQSSLPGNTNSSPASSIQANSAAVTAQASFASSPSTADWNGHAHSPECDEAESGDDIGASSICENISCSGFQNSSLQLNDRVSKDISGCRGSIPSSFSRGLTNIAGMNNGLPDLFSVNQLLTGTCMTNEPNDASLLASGQAGLPEFSATQIAGQPFCGTNLSHGTGSFAWPEVQGTSQSYGNIDGDRFFFNNTNSMGDMTRSGFNVHPGLLKSNQVGVQALPEHSQEMIKDSQRLFQGQASQGDVMAPGGIAMDRQNLSDISHMNPEPFSCHDHVPSECQVNKSHVNPSSYLQTIGTKADPADSSKGPLVDNLYNDENLGLKKLDSFGRWMSREIGVDCDEPLTTSDSGNYWSTLNPQVSDKDVSSLSGHMQLDVDPLGPSLSQEQLFSIIDFSPDWAYSGVETKVLISGVFLADTEYRRAVKWCCMFGELEVSAEILTNNVLRCQAPVHSPGRVPFYITCSNRLACSEVREFDYRERPSALSLPVGLKGNTEDETVLQVRLAKMLVLGSEKRWLSCCLENCEKCHLKKDILSLRGDDTNEWDEIEKSVKHIDGNYRSARELLMQKMLKDKLYQWLVCKSHEEGKGPNFLDDEGQGVIHLAAALGYEWAMGPIVAAGVSPSFRDARGRTGLHWAAYFGREETVVTLIRLGAAPGALEDPTAKFPQGQTAADLASSRGHKGIAGYLAEADLTSHLSSISLRENLVDNVAATLAVQKAIETVEKQRLLDPLDGDMKDELSLKQSLAAVRKSAQAAARIQAAFRVHSFRQRQLAESSSGSLDNPRDIHNLVNAKMTLRKGQSYSTFDVAAVKIQQKYRGWKARKDFVKIRERIVKIQAHFRGHQVRKQYKKVVWSVGIVEKAILRWRRKGVGLRGFRADRSIQNAESAGGKSDEYEFLRDGRKQKVAGVEKALARVQSMVRYPEARDQYMRLVTNFQKAKIMDDKASAAVVLRSKENKDVHMRQ
ncbi:Calmodulin-binding transcription activator 2, partial [Nymphaea thermarum]